MECAYVIYVETSRINVRFSDTTRSVVTELQMLIKSKR